MADADSMKVMKATMEDMVRQLVNSHSNNKSMSCAVLCYDGQKFYSAGSECVKDFCDSQIIKDAFTSQAKRVREAAGKSDATPNQPCKIGTLVLPDYVAKVPVCIAQDRTVIAATSKTTLTRYQLTDNGYQKLQDVDMSATLRIDPNYGFRIHCAQETGYAIRAWKKKEKLTTYIYDNDLCLKDKFDDQVGHLMTVAKDKLVYQEEIMGQETLQMYDITNHHIVGHLMPAARKKWSENLAVGSNRDGCIVVSDWENLFICIFDELGKHVHHIPLTYKPSYGFISGNDRHIFSPEHKSVHVHAWDGENLGSFSHAALELSESDVISSTWCSDRDVMHIRVWDGASNHKLIAYKLDYTSHNTIMKTLHIEDG